MMKKIIYNMQGIFSVIWISVNTVICVCPLFIVVILKSIVPIKIWRVYCSKILDTIAWIWIGVNNFYITITKRISWQITGLENLQKKKWYLVISNHQTWLDIVVLQRIFNGKIPMLKFFIKDELKWVPLLGLAWWALDFPFMKRHSQSYIDKHPEVKSEDILSTRKACEKFKHIPVSVMNFIEGHRFTPGRHEGQKSPFNNLLRPKAGGMAFVLSALGNIMNSILDVTIVYPEGDTGFWSFLCGKIKKIVVIIEEIPLDEKYIGDYENDSEFKKWFQERVNGIWERKDSRIREVLAENDVK